MRQAKDSMLRMVAPTDSADITVIMGAPAEVGTDEPGGDYELRDTGGGVYERCNVRTMNVSGGASNLEWLSIYHELGHCMGLTHDDFTLSIMYPEQRPTPDRTIPPWITDWDRELLRGKYGP